MESLYRKYRPLTFDGVVGQQHIVSTLEHAVTEGRLSHAYLFCGPRGTGKTTMARILAKSLLCEHAAAAREGGASGCLPDGTCEECRQIAEGTHPDVYELDAASRTGVDNVREEIIGSVNFAPVRGAYKVYIIDEVHMLTTAAFNALLKTLEEPPAHVVFVMCTTDPQKIPETILSRCQRFEFHRIGNADIQGRLAYICGQEGFTYDDEALRIVAKHARGGMRDALSTLEQLSVFGNGAVTLEDARALLGEVPGEILSDFARAIAARDVVALFGLVRDQVNEGSDLMELTRDLVAHVRDIYMVRVAGAGRGIIDGTPDEAAALSEEASLFEGGDRLARALTVLDDAVLEMRNASDTRLVLEIALTRLSRPESDLTLEALAERIDRLEARLAGGAPAPAAARDRAVAVPAPSPSTEGEGGAGAKRPDDAGAASDGSLPWSLPAAAPRSSSEARPADSAPFVPFTQAKSSRPARTAPAMPPQPVSGDEPPRCARGGASTAADGPRRAEADSGTSSDPAAPVVPSGASAAEVAASSAPSTPAVRDDGELQRRWAEVVKLVTKRNPPRGGLLLNSRAKSDDGAVLTVGLPAGSGFAAKMLAREDSHEAIMPVVASVFGSRRIQYEMARDGAASVKQGAPASPRPASGSSSSPMAAAPQERSATAPAPADELSAADSSEDGRARVDAAPIPGKPAAPAAGEGAGPDQSTGPTVLPEPDVESDRRAWEDDVVPYDDDMIAEIEGSDPAFAPGPTEADAALEPIRLEPAAPAPVVPGSSVPAASPVEEGAPAAPAPSPLAGINFVGGAAPEEGHAPTMEEAGDVLDAVFGGHTFLGHDGWGAPSQDDPE